MPDMVTQLVNLTAKQKSIPESREERSEILRRFPGLLAKANRRFPPRTRPTSSAMTLVWGRHCKSARIEKAILGTWADMEARFEHGAEQAEGNRA